MTRLLTTTALAVALIATCFAANASADSYRLAPPSPGYNTNPAFGFWANVSYGNGYYVTGVNSYSAASQFGLQRGDVIQGAYVNGRYRSLAYGGWNSAVRDARYSGGNMLLYVRDRNTGRTVQRWTNTHRW